MLDQWEPETEHARGPRRSPDVWGDGLEQVETCLYQGNSFRFSLIPGATRMWWSAPEF